MMKLIEKTPFPDIFCKPKDKNLLFQGDIIRYSKFLTTEKENLGVIILSNSCDLERLKNKITISVAPIYPFNFVFDEMIQTALKKTKNKINEEKSNKHSRKFDYIDYFKDLVSNFILEEANYKKKYTYFISPLPEFDNKPSVAIVDNIYSISKNFASTLIKNRIISINVPWREKLGFKVGNLFNRVATYTPKHKDIKNWWIKAYPKIFEEKKKEIEGII